METSMESTGTIPTSSLLPVTDVTIYSAISDIQAMTTVANVTLGNITGADYLQNLSNQQASDFWPVFSYIGILLFFGTIGNVLVLYVHILKFKPSSTRTFVISLACFDLLSCLLAMPGEVLDIRFAYNYPSPILCKLMRTIASFVAIASGFTLMAVSYDRFSRICRPLKRQMGHKAASLWVAVASVASIIVSFPISIISGAKTVETDIGNITGYECSVSDEYRESKFPLIYTIVLFLVFIMAFVAMIAAYASIGRQIMKQNTFRKSFTSNRHRTITNTSVLEPEKREHRNRKISSTSLNNAQIESCQSSGENESDNPTASYAEKRKVSRKQSILNITKKSPNDTRALMTRTTMMLFLISLVFLLSFLPHLILKAWQALQKGLLDDTSLTGQIFYNIFVRSYFINSVSNAFIYGFCSPRFRKECKSICKMIARKRSFSLNSNSFNYV